MYCVSASLPAPRCPHALLACAPTPPSSFHPHPRRRQSSRYAHQLERFACIYTSHVSNLIFYSPLKSYRGAAGECRAECAVWAGRHAVSSADRRCPPAAPACPSLVLQTS